jgi:polysaccharide pyruvyl transferase WcaK-like protein
MRCLLIGNYGVGNVGDEFLKDYFLKAFPDVSWHVLSAHPENGQLPRIPTGIRSFLGFGWVKTVSALKQSDAVVFGGGSLFTDAESVTACWIWFVHAFVASLYRKPILLAFQGVGPFKSRLGRVFSGWVIRHATFISVRDKVSVDRVQTFGENIKVVQSFDPVLALISNQIHDGSNNVLIVIPRPNSGDLFVGRAVDRWKGGALTSARILSFEPDNPMEHTLCQKLHTVLNNSTLIAVRGIHDLASAFSGAGLVLTHRYHGAIIALALGIPFEAVFQKPGDKLDEVTAHAAVGRDRCMDDVRRGEESLRAALQQIRSGDSAHSSLP